MPKAYIERLEAQITSLRQDVASKRRELDALRRVNGTPVDLESNHTPPNRRDVPAVRFVGEEHAMGFIKLDLGSIQNEAKKSLYVLREDQMRQTHQTLSSNENPPEDDCIPLDVELGIRLLNTYLRCGHPRHPFLAYSAIVAVCEKVLHAGSSNEHVTNEEIFRAYSLMAIGAAYMAQEVHACASQSESIPSPARLFSEAMPRGGKVNMVTGLAGLQNLLLISRYGFFCLTGASLWEISSLCIHICIDHGLHRKPRVRLHAFEEQMQRRVFWQCYNLNRHCATTLGLPFSIPDAEITVGPIVDIEDELLYSTSDPLDVVATSPSGAWTSLSLMIWQVRQRQICSRMREEYKSLRHARQPAAEVLQECDDIATIWDIHANYAEQLSTWRSQYPIQFGEVPQHESYLNVTWRDLHYFQEKLLLVRCSIEHLSSYLDGMENPLELMDELYESASAVVRLYSQLLKDARM